MRRLVVVAVMLVASAAAADDPLAEARAARERRDYPTAITLLERALPNHEAEMLLAETLAWANRFEESEARYRALPPTRTSRLGLARVILWQHRYAEAAEHFDALLRENADDLDALEGRATAAYWSGDLRTAARGFRRVLAREPQRETSRTSLAEIAAVTAPSQRLALDASRDDQPLDVARAELSADVFSDPLTRWTFSVGTYRLDHDRRGTRDGELVRIANETQLPAQRLTLGASLGVFTFPDGTRRPIGHASVGWRELTLRVERREEIASATAIPTHAYSTTTSLRWHRENERIVAAAEASRRSYFDDNSGSAFVAYAVAPLLRRAGWTVWGGASAAVRDTDTSRFHVTATSSSLDASGTFFHYAYRGEYDPYWTPDDLREARAVVAVERAFGRGSVKLHADGGYARDRGRAFGPDAGLAPFPVNVTPFGFDREYHPYRGGMTAALTVMRGLRLELAYEHATTVDYRSNTFHAALARRR